MSKLQVEITALDRISSELVKVNGQINNFTRNTERAFGGLTKVMGVFGGAMTTVFAANKVAEIVNAGLEYGRSVQLLSNRLGMGVEATQQWDYVTKRMGTSVEALARPLKQMDTLIYDNSGKLKALGIATRDSNGAFRDKSEVLKDVLIRLSEIPDPTERSVVATKLFGKASTEMLAIVGQGPEKIRSLIAETQQYGLILSREMIDKLDRAREKQELLNKQLEITKVKFAAAISPLVSTWLSGANIIIEGLSKWITSQDKVTSGLKEQRIQLESNIKLAKEQVLKK